MFKSALRQSLYTLGLARLARWWHEEQFCILMYHGLVPAGEAPLRTDRVAADDFAWQLAFLAEHYEVRPLHEWMEGARPGQRPGAAITFDDGYRSVLTLAAPLLREYDLTATVFLCPALIDSNTLPWFEQLYLLSEQDNWPLKQWQAEVKRLKALPPSAQAEALAELQQQAGGLPAVPDDSHLLNWQEIQQLSGERRVHFGAHTQRHTILSRLSLEEQQQEILDSCDAVADHCGDCRTFAYPNGKRADFQPETVEILRRSGLSGAVTSLPGLADPEGDTFLWPRLSVGPATTPAGFALRTAGLYTER